MVGGGFAGCSAAARLAKLRHDVTLIEASEQLGGLLLHYRAGSNRWPLYPETVTLPGVFRDLFRKSGRPIERVIEMSPGASRQHWFPDRTVLELRFGRRGDQWDAIHQTFGTDAWSPWIDSLGADWEIIRKTSLDRMQSNVNDRRVAKQIKADTRLNHLAKRLFSNPQLRSMLTDRDGLDDQKASAVHAPTAVWHYVERNFGLWSFVGGFESLAIGLDNRLRERRVTIQTGTRALDVELIDDKVNAVVTDAGRYQADAVVWCAPALPPSVRFPKLRRVPARARTLLKLDGGLHDFPQDVITHGPHSVRAFRSGTDLLTIAHSDGVDAFDTLSQSGAQIDSQVSEHHVLSAEQMSGIVHDGWVWPRRGAPRRYPGTAGHNGLYFAGAHALPGNKVELIGMGTAAIAAAIGPAPRPVSS